MAELKTQEEVPTPRSKTIPPISRQKISGTFEIDGDQKKLRRKHKFFQKVPPEDRNKWEISGTILQDFQVWSLLPPEIKDNNNSPERKEIIGFVSQGENKDENDEYEIPSLEAINTEIACIVLETIPEWNALVDSEAWKNMMDEKRLEYESEMIRFVSQKFPEFQEPKHQTPEEENTYRTIHSNHYDKYKPHDHRTEMEKKRKIVIDKIIDKIKELQKIITRNWLKTRRVIDIRPIRKEIEETLANKVDRERPTIPVPAMPVKNDGADKEKK